MKNLILFFLIVGCAHSPKPETSPKRIVLIQGVHLDELSWGPVKSRLETHGYEIQTLNRLGRDRAPSASLRDIARQSCEAVPKRSTVVAHSFGGAIVNAMVGICPEKIARIIYVSALVPISGEKPFLQMSNHDQMEYGKAVDFKMGQIKPKNPYQFFKVTDPTYRYHKRTAPPLYGESMNLSMEAVEYDEKVLKEIPRSYIYTLKDNVISLKTQEFYTSRSQITQTAGVQTGHFPMISNPEALTMEILNFAKKTEDAD